MYPLKLDRGQAASRYGKTFVKMMMRESPIIFMEERQDIMALRAKAMRENRITPYHNEWVYVIHNGQGLTKIGRSYMPRQRFSALCAGALMDLYFFGAVVFGHGGAPICEKAAHRRLKEDGHHKKGEWFEISPQDAFRLVKTIAPKSLGTTDLAGVKSRADELFPLFEAMTMKEDEPRVLRARKARDEFNWVVAQMNTKVS